MPHLWPTGSSYGVAPSITARYFSSCPSDSTSRWTPCPPVVLRQITNVGPSPWPYPPFPALCPFRVFPIHFLRPARRYPRFWIWPPSSGSQRDFNPPDLSAVQRTLLGYPTPCSLFAFLPLRLSGILSLLRERHRPPGLPCNHNIKHAMVSDPEEAGISLPFAEMSVLTSTSLTVSSFPARQLRGSIPSTFRLTAYLLAVLRLKRYVAIQPPRTRCPVVGQPSGAGFTPAGLHDLARPH